MYEHYRHKLLPRREFIKRIARSILLGILLSLIALGVGMVGYKYYENLSWMDSYLNAAMILSGMGPLWNPHTYAGKFFAGSYALFSGLFFLFILGIIFAPIIHRFLHKFHLEDTHSK